MVAIKGRRVGKDDLLTTSEAAAEYGKSLVAWRQACERGSIPDAINKGGRWLIRRESAEKYIEIAKRGRSSVNTILKAIYEEFDARKSQGITPKVVRLTLLGETAFIGIKRSGYEPYGLNTTTSGPAQEIFLRGVREVIQKDYKGKFFGLPLKVEFDWAKPDDQEAEYVVE